MDVFRNASGFGFFQIKVINQNVSGHHHHTGVLARKHWEKPGWPLPGCFGKYLLYSSGNEMCIGEQVSYTEKVPLKPPSLCDKRKIFSS